LSKEIYTASQPVEIAKTTASPVKTS